MTIPPVQRPTRRAQAWRPVTVIAGLALLVVPARARVVPCRAADAGPIADALQRLRESRDPCGESPEVRRVLARVERCASSRYEICTSSTAWRNAFDRSDGAPRRGLITWNPDLHTELEGGCDGDPTRPVTRDPTASLLHELVHALHDCEGLNPGEHELEAVRIENIYRRAAGLCQRSRYGDRFAPEVMKPCSPGRCACAVQAKAIGRPRPPLHSRARAAGPTDVGDAPRPSSGSAGRGDDSSAAAPVPSPARR